MKTIQRLHCHFARTRLDAYARRELNPFPHRIIRHHLDTCSECAEALAQHRTMIVHLQRELSHIRPSSDQSKHIWQQIQHGITNEPRVKTLHWREGATAAAALLLVIPLLIGTQSAQSPELANTVLVQTPVVEPSDHITATPEVQTLPPPEATLAAPVRIALLHNTPDLLSDPIEGLP